MYSNSMIKIWIRYLLVAVVLLQAGMAKGSSTTLSHGEHLFKSDLSYHMKDFKPRWRMDAFVVLRYDIFGMDSAIRFKDLKPVFRGGKIHYTLQIKKDIEALANMMLKRGERYFLNKPHGIRSIFHLVIFRKDGKTYALESFGELNMMLGTLDTPAKLLLWLRLKNLSTPHSYLYTHGLWRVRFAYSTHCSHGEYFEFYDRNGKYIKRQEIKSHTKKNCEEIIAD